jgi:protein SCO1/2
MMRSSPGYLRQGAAIALAAALWTAGGGVGLAHDNEPHDSKLHSTQPQATAVQESAVPGATDGADFSPFPADIGGPFALVSHTGQAVTDADFHGRHMLVFFGYARCEAICPVGLKQMTEAVNLLGALGERVQPVLISVDPEVDTPEALARHVPTIHPRLIGLTGSPEAIAAVKAAYKVDSKAMGQSWKGTSVISHGSYIYLMAPDGTLLSVLPPVLGPETMAEILRRYMS